MSGKGKSGKDWIHVLAFNAYFEDALAKFRAKTGYGVTYALYNALNEYFHETKDMTEEGYLYNKQRYAETLIEAKKRKEQAKPLAEIEVEERKQQELQRTEKILTEVYNNWDTYKPSAQRYHLRTAERYSELPIAQLILKKGVSNA